MSNIDNFDTPKYKNLSTYLNVEEITSINRVEILSNLLVEKRKYRVEDGRDKVVCFCGHKIKNYQYIHNKLNGEKLFAGSSCVHIFDICNPTCRTFIDRQYYSNFSNLFGSGEFINIEDWGEYTKSCLYQYLSDCTIENYNSLLEIYKNYDDIIKLISENYSIIQTNRRWERMMEENRERELEENIERERLEEERILEENRERQRLEEERMMEENREREHLENERKRTNFITELERELKWRTFKKNKKLIDNKNRVISQLKENNNFIKNIKTKVKNHILPELIECPIVIQQRIKQNDYDRKKELLQDKKWNMFIKTKMYINNNPICKYRREDWKQTDAYKNFTDY
jgi:PAS domain-containing protein